MSITIKPHERLHKARCHNDNNTFFYYTSQGISLKCRHCKGVQVIPWMEILTKHRELSEECAEEQRKEPLDAADRTI